MGVCGSCCGGGGAGEEKRAGADGGGRRGGRRSAEHGEEGEEEGEDRQRPLLRGAERSEGEYARSQTQQRAGKGHNKADSVSEQGLEVGEGALANGNGSVEDVEEAVTATVEDVVPLREHFDFAAGSALQQLRESLAAREDLELTPAIVKLPPGVREKRSWIAVHIAEFYNNMSTLYGAIGDACTPTTCPHMSAGSAFRYLWVDTENAEEPKQVTAMEYVLNTLDATEQAMSDEDLFRPEGTDYPGNFDDVCEDIMRKLFRIYAHVFYSHYKDLGERSGVLIVDFSFRWFLFFAIEHKLVSRKDMTPLADTISAILAEYDQPSIFSRKSIQVDEDPLA